VDKRSCHRVQESQQGGHLTERRGSHPLAETCPDAEIVLLSCRTLQEHSCHRDKLQRWKETDRWWQWKDL